MSDVNAPVLLAVRNRIGNLTLNRPAALEDDPQILAVVLRGSGIGSEIRRSKRKKLQIGLNLTLGISHAVSSV
jgi:hypothetical protein